MVLCLSVVEQSHYHLIGGRLFFQRTFLMIEGKLLLMNHLISSSGILGWYKLDQLVGCTPMKAITDASTTSMLKIYFFIDLIPPLFIF